MLQIARFDHATNCSHTQRMQTSLFADCTRTLLPLRQEDGSRPTGSLSRIKMVIARRAEPSAD
jgi:hypothetical protein